MIFQNIKNLTWFHYLKHEIKENRHKFHVLSFTSLFSIEKFCWVRIFRFTMETHNVSIRAVLSQDFSATEVKNSHLRAQDIIFTNLYDIFTIRAWGARFGE